MIHLIYSDEKTNSFRPKPWHWSETPFPAFRGAGARYSVFQPVASGFVPSWAGQAPTSDGYSCPRWATCPAATKMIQTARGTLLLVPCRPEEDERIVLATLRGGFRGGYSRVEAHLGEILVRKDGNIHCCPTAHLVVRLQPGGYIYAETGRRSSTGLVEVFAADLKPYFTMPTEEFEVWRDQGSDLLQGKEQS